MPNPLINLPPGGMFLSKRQYDVVRLVAQGHTVVSAAKELYVTNSTAKTHMEKARQKYKAKTNAELIYRMMKMGHLW